MFGRRKNNKALKKEMERIRVAGEALAEGIQAGIDAAKEFDEAEDWAEDMAKAVDEAFRTEPEPKKKGKKKKKTADELFEKLGYVKASEDIEMVEYRSEEEFSKIVIRKREATRKGYTVRCEALSLGSSSYLAQWIAGEEVEAIRRKAKEKGWR